MVEEVHTQLLMEVEVHTLQKLVHNHSSHSLCRQEVGDRSPRLLVHCILEVDSWELEVEVVEVGEAVEAGEVVEVVEVVVDGGTCCHA